MSLRSGHGTGRGTPHVEVLPADELPVGVPDPSREAGSDVKRNEAGHPADAEAARELGRRGGKARAGKSRLAERLGLGDTFDDPRFAPYARSAKAFRKAQTAQLTRDVGGGFCGADASSIVASAALQLAGSRFAFEVLGDLTLGSKLADASRQNLLAAHELVARAALARRENGQELSRRPAEFEILNMQDLNEAQLAEVAQGKIPVGAVCRNPTFARLLFGRPAAHLPDPRTVMPASAVARETAVTEPALHSEAESPPVGEPEPPPAPPVARPKQLPKPAPAQDRTSSESAMRDVNARADDNSAAFEEPGIAAQIANTFSKWRH